MVTVRVVLAAMVALFASGCSFMFVEGPPPREQRERRFDCTTSMVWPVVDGLGVAFQGVRVGYAFSQSEEDYRGSFLSRPVDIGVGLGLMLVHAVSAYAGDRRVTECRAALPTAHLRGAHR